VPLLGAFAIKRNREVVLTNIFKEAYFLPFILAKLSPQYNARNGTNY
jgi:hypothetical protein